LKDARGGEKTGTSNEEGRVDFANLPPGAYDVIVVAEHFQTFGQHFELPSGPDFRLYATLAVASVDQNISVVLNSAVTQEAEYVGGSLVIRGDTLLSLDLSGGLDAFLRVIAIRSPGPFGPTALVNGFEDGELPPIYSIREV